MDLCKIKKFIDFFEEFNFVELEIKEGEEVVCLLCVFKGGVVVVVVFVLVVVVLVLVVVVLVVVFVVEVLVVDVLLEGYVVKVLMVGIFYVFFILGVLVFVKVGQQVKVGEMLGIIEVMKMFNQIEVDVVGMVKVILVENGQLVEFDQFMFVIV